MTGDLQLQAGPQLHESACQALNLSLELRLVSLKSVQSKQDDAYDLPLQSKFAMSTRESMNSSSTGAETQAAKTSPAWRTLIKANRMIPDAVPAIPFFQLLKNINVLEAQQEKNILSQINTNTLQLKQQIGILMKYLEFVLRLNEEEYLKIQIEEKQLQTHRLRCQLQVQNNLPARQLPEEKILSQMSKNKKELKMDDCLLIWSTNRQYVKERTPTFNPISSMLQKRNQVLEQISTLRKYYSNQQQQLQRQIKIDKIKLANLEYQLQTTPQYHPLTPNKTPRKLSIKHMLSPVRPKKPALCDLKSAR